MTNEMQGLTGTSRKMTNKEAYQLANLAENKGYNDVGPHGGPSYKAQGGDRQFGPAPQNSMQVSAKRELTRGQVMSTDRVIGAANVAVRDGRLARGGVRAPGRGRLRRDRVRGVPALAHHDPYSTI